MVASLSAEDVRDLQGILVHGYGHLDGACFVLCEVDPDHVRSARKYLAHLGVTDVPTARSARKSRAHGDRKQPFVNVALTHEGLGALGLDGTLLDSFPREFVEGLTTEPRARMLGDVGESHPRNWRWGAPTTRPIHVALLLYATPDELKAHRGSVLAAAHHAGLREVTTLETIRLPRRQEHFGFRDGISQPVIRGSREPSPYDGDEIAPGEMLLGHPDAFGETSHVPGDQPFGRNGSYMVLRQLEQKVADFWEFCRKHAETEADVIHLAAKMVGRWPSGAPLMKYPDRDPGPDARSGSGPRAADDNEFMYATDPHGHRCPFASHVRRSNPRDGFVSKAEDSLAISGRRRIIRRARAYGAPLCEDAEPASYLETPKTHDVQSSERGLQFICFNASLERQFEFVQQQWCENPKLTGAVNGSDPLIGSQRTVGEDAPCFTLPSPAGQAARRLYGLTRFVTVRGGAYFFLPSLSALRNLG